MKPCPQGRRLRAPPNKMDGGPTRSCAGCRKRRPQAELIRIVRRPDGRVVLDLTGSAILGRGSAGRAHGGRAPGRGAYVCLDEACVERAVRTSGFKRTLRVDYLPDGLREEILRAVGETKGIDG